ncbi:MAG: hypothetical protein AAF615_02115, partial [Pseudomonadota bacterium]
MTEKNLIVPDQNERRAARRLARLERRRALAERQNTEAGGLGAEAALPATGRAPGGVPVDASSFKLPPKARLEKTNTRFGNFVKMTFALFVVAPTVLTVLFYGFVAAD